MRNLPSTEWVSPKPSANAADRALQLIRPEIRALRPYHVPDATGLVKLDAMENPYSWPADLRGPWLEFLADAPLNRYPDPGGTGIKRGLQDAGIVPRDAQVLLGNGSDEIILMLMLALERGRAVLAPVPTFVMYELLAKSVGLRFEGVPLAPGFRLDAESLVASARRCHAGLIFLAYPNNPTGNLFAEDQVEHVIRNVDGLVVLDEAYFPFARRTFMQRLGDFPNLVVMRTLSKEGLAGVRLGFLAGARAWIEELDKVRLPYNVNRLSQLTVEFALAHREVLAAQAALIRAERERVFAALSVLPRVHPWPSDANFILFEAPDADRLFARLCSDGILIKSLAGSGLPGYLRVTVGSTAENDLFLGALERALDPS